MQLAWDRTWALALFSGCLGDLHVRVELRNVVKYKPISATEARLQRIKKEGLLFRRPAVLIPDTEV